MIEPHVDTAARRAEIVAASGGQIAIERHAAAGGTQPGTGQPAGLDLDPPAHCARFELAGQAAGFDAAADRFQRDDGRLPGAFDVQIAADGLRFEVAAGKFGLDVAGHGLQALTSIHPLDLDARADRADLEAAAFRDTHDDVARVTASPPGIDDFHPGPIIVHLEFQAFDPAAQSAGDGHLVTVPAGDLDAAGDVDDLHQPIRHHLSALVDGRVGHREHGVEDQGETQEQRHSVQARSGGAAGYRPAAAAETAKDLPPGQTMVKEGVHNRIS